MDADHLYTSERSAEQAGLDAVSQRKADKFRVKPRTTRNDDRSADFGFVTVLFKSGKMIGFA